MPYDIRKLPNQELYRVYNKQTKAVHSYATTLENAKKQVKLLHMVDAGVVVGGAISQAEKIEIANQIRPITEQNAIQSYLDLADEKTIPPNTSKKGNKFVDYFTFLERLETTGKGGMSFWDFWEKKSEYMKKQYVKNLIAYYRKNGNTNVVKQFFQIFQIYFGSISIFKPVIAMNIYHRFKPTSILDFTMGWGGRLVGATALNIPNYIGIDLNKNLEKPYKEMVKTIKELGTDTNIKLIFKDALKVDYSKLNYDMVFTSPPYYNVEIYRGTNKMTKKEWNEKLYKPLFTETWKYLKTGGHYILNVPIEVYDNVLINLLGKADIFIPLNIKRPMSKKVKQPEYKEYMYVWIKNGIKKGGSVETDDFKSDGIVSLPEFRSVKINLPTYMYKRLPDIKGKPPPYRYRLVVPITSSRNISSRKKETSLDISQKAVVKPVVDITESSTQVFLKDFSPADKLKIQQYYYKVEENERKNPDEIDKDDYQVIPRGKPLPCSNASSSSSSSSSSSNKTPNVRAMVANIEKSIPKSVSTSSKKQSKEKLPRGRPKNLPMNVVLSGESDYGDNNSLDDFDPKADFDPEAYFEKELGGTGINNILSNSKMANKWIEYVKAFCAKTGMSYRDALRSPECKAGYKKGGGLVPPPPEGFRDKVILAVQKLIDAGKIPDVSLLESDEYVRYVYTTMSHHQGRQKGISEVITLTALPFLRGKGYTGGDSL